jgi:phospholipid/cholesterol/gamma-HCH transport system permease protein
MPEDSPALVAGWIAQLGAQAYRLTAWARERVIHFGMFVRFVVHTAKGFRSVRSWAKWSRLGAQLYFVGTTSAPVLALVGAFIGMILALEGYVQFAAIGQEGRLGGVINVSLVKQIGPVLAAVMLAGRVGCSLTAELGSMRVTEQLDAMRAMAADPVRVLVCPRVIACILMIPPLTVISNLCGVIGGWAITTKFYTADPVQFWRFSEVFVSWFSVLNGLVKSVFFGGAIGLIACYKGFHCKPGAEGVGRATTDSFVTSFIAIIFINLVLAKLLNDIDFLRNKGNLTTLFG